ncbi:acyl-CoA dehydrogenase family protein [Novosphingobium sp. 9U]|uniref:acyl-CoA dehydrogenase family protein n=1 Tax=Novosphingobium sp. 9U TaxID=2653158 RepID=UPI0012F258A6|nr:acyl-CoA dehydrogenase family protein [Novosphingobium sp. 9U]VWX49947.1 Acyl-CoA dehydrogenase family protein [Novosphingobium sp. 9U]
MEASESVRMIRDSVGAIAPAGGDLKRVRALRFDAFGLDQPVWQQVVDLGWLSLRLDEERGGLGLGVRELCAIGEELGAALVPEPVLAVAAMVPLLNDAERDKVLEGSLIVVPAWREGINKAGEAASMSVSDGTVSGRKILVPSAVMAGAFVVTTAEGAVLVERDAPGLTIESYKTQDGGQISTLSMSSTPCTLLIGDAQDALHELSLAHSAYLLGATERAFQMTLDYLGIRKQFGKFIGSFQVLQHRAAEAKIQLALSHAVLDEAVTSVESGASKSEQVRSAARALARVSDTAMLIARESVQMHGAIGITDEHDIGLYCRKILSIYNQFGTANANRARYLAAAGGES